MTFKSLIYEKHVFKGEVLQFVPIYILNAMFLITTIL